MKTLEAQDFNKIQKVLDVLKQHGVSVPAGASAKLSTFVESIRKWNRRTQLVSRNDEDSLVSAHIAECLAPPCVFDFQRLANLLDFGSGAGLPGIPLAIIFPDLEVSLLEPKRKKLLFLRFCSEELKLENISILPYYSKEIPNSDILVYDAVIARAVAPLEKLWKWSRRFLKNETRLLAMKGGDLSAEIQECKTCFQSLKLTIAKYPRELVALEKDRKLVIINEPGQKQSIHLSDD
ncbi:MAG: 16S rRNA (guanine(527)-N(7))-methyltransferase RsmG [bacterium]